MSAAHGDKLEVILDAAFRLFGSSGFYETKMSEIADEAGIAKGTLYLYFTSKEELFTAVTKRDFDRFLEQLGPKLEAAGFLEDKLQVIASHHLGYYYSVRDYTRLFFHTPNRDQKLMDTMYAFISAYTRMIAAMLEEHGVTDSWLHAKSFIGILDVFKMDILFNPAFSEQDLAQRTGFAVRLFRYGCKPDTAENREHTS
ncbi:TetR family transcriptional regulator [Paenibacillus sambharensis]|uniref:TetR family transcriptional regulator n=1 Tax=Paenibacillus sambharensis TaxID=1803190 RepID=A0A2W1LCZ9_9BACL|nr:TetR/AcrR family transcriptional regulator [Paenibacillus sambharensis]PZD95940.1 TetR family transcriptional regulator [Paenibacillus sambharensis]